MRTYLPDMATITFIKMERIRQFTQNVNEGILFIRSGLSLFGLLPIAQGFYSYLNVAKAIVY